RKGTGAAWHIVGPHWALFSSPVPRNVDANNSLTTTKPRRRAPVNRFTAPTYEREAAHRTASPRATSSQSDTVSAERQTDIGGFFRRQRALGFQRRQRLGRGDNLFGADCRIVEQPSDGGGKFVGHAVVLQQLRHGSTVEHQIQQRDEA